MKEFYQTLEEIASVAESYNPKDTKNKDYWDNWLSQNELIIESSTDIDPLQKSLYEVIKAAVECDQYLAAEDELVDVERVVKFRVKLPREAIHNLFKIKTYSIYGIGLFTKMEGLLLSPSTRDEIRYDAGREKGVPLDLSRFSEEILSTHEFRLAVPALSGGLFIPKKTRLTEWIGGSWALQYFDILKY